MIPPLVVELGKALEIWGRLMVVWKKARRVSDVDRAYSALSSAIHTLEPEDI